MKQAERLFGELSELPIEQRASVLDRRCAGNARLRSWVEHLLAIDDSDVQGLLHLPACVSVNDDAAGLERSVPERVGSYRIVRRIGEGGMGVVYEARQRNPSRTVALKVVRSHWPSRDTLRRFRHECQILGQLQHPGIAQIHEADAAEVRTSTGLQLRQPFLAMEFVRGKRLDRHARDNKLSTVQRLELVARLCDAVQYAHLKGVIHRDLKPGNILVDEHGQPKILDFGVARATHADVQTLTLQTNVGQLIGTLGYMSPEQVVGDPRHVDTRADLYSLGVILHELLCGKLPLDVSGRSIPEAARIIRDENPLPISSVERALRGDIQTICAKALEKDATRRYQSARDLADDIRRFLRGEPIGARRDSAVYMLRKTLSRYRWPVGALAVFVVLLGTFAAYALTQARSYRALAQREARATQQAQTSAARAAAVKDFLQQMLAAADPSRAGGRNVTVREVLDDASRRIAAGLLSGEPAVEAEVRTTIAHTYFNLGMNGAAIPHYEWVRDYREDRLGPQAGAAIEALCWLGRAHIEAPSPEPALPIFERAVDVALDALGPEHELTLLAMDGLGAALTRIRREAEAEALHRDVLEGVRRLYGDEHALFVSTSLHLGQVYARQRKFDEAERLYLKALKSAQQLHGSQARVTIRLRWQLASEIYARTERLAQAETLLSETLADAQTALGPEHTETIIVLTRLSRVLEQAGRVGEAEGLLRDAIANLGEVRAAEGDDTIRPVAELARLLSRQDRHEEAVALLREGLESAQNAPGHHPLLLAAWIGQLAWIEGDRGNFGAAADIERRVLALRQAHLGPNHSNVGTSWWRLGNYLYGLVSYDTGPVAECIAARRRALELFRNVEGETHRATIDATITLAWGLMVQRDYESAEELLTERLRHVRAELGEFHAETQRVSSYLGSLAQYTGRDIEAATLSRQWAEALQEKEPRNHYGLGIWWLRSGESLYLAADYEGAIEALRASIAALQAAERPDSVAVVQAALAEALIGAGQSHAAMEVAQAAVNVLQFARLDRPAYRLDAQRALAHALVARGDCDEGELKLRACIEACDTLPLSLTEVQVQAGRAQSVLGECLTRMGRHAEAEDALLEAYDLLTAACGEHHGFARNARARIVALYERWKRPGDAASAELWRARGPAASPQSGG